VTSDEELVDELLGGGAEDELTVEELLVLEHRILIGVDANGSAATIQTAIKQLRRDVTTAQLARVAIYANAEALFDLTKCNSTLVAAMCHALDSLDRALDRIVAGAITEQEDK
jgi:hypothetical protein